MARTKQTARKATGQQPSRRQRATTSVPTTSAKRKAEDDSPSVDSDGYTASRPVVARSSIRSDRVGVTPDNAILLASPPVIAQVSSSSSSSSFPTAADEQLSKKGRFDQLLKKARVEGSVAGRKKLSRRIAKDLICPITHTLLAFPVLADDDRTYERSAILKWLETHNTSPLDPSVAISAATLRKIGRPLTGVIDGLVKSDGIDDEAKEAWQEKRDEPQRLFDEGRYLEAAAFGDVKVIGQIALNYYIEKDYDKAFDFATKAANGGDGRGSHVLGNCYFYGHGVAIDNEAAMKWHEKAAKKGDLISMHLLGQRYSSGKGCVEGEKDDKKAAEHFKNASKRGHELATNELGNCYYEGAGVAKNFDTARALFGTAAIRKNPAGDVNLGTMMIRGEGGAKEVGEGFMRIEKAAGAGNRQAVAHLAEIDFVVKQWAFTGVSKFGTL